METGIQAAEMAVRSEFATTTFVAIIVGWFAFGVLCLLLPLLLRSWSLRRQRGMLKRAERQGRSLQERQERLLGSVRRIQWSRTCWETFARTWRDLYSETERRATLPVMLIEFLPQERVIPRIANRRLAGVLPGTLVALGILGTFWGLYIGIPGGIADRAAAEQAIRQLVGGLKTAVVTSLWGIGCSIIFMVADRIAMQWLTVAVRKTSDAAEVLFPYLDARVAQERSARAFGEIQTNLQTLATDVATALSNTLVPAMNQAIGDAVRGEVAPAIKELRDVAERLEGSVGQMPAALEVFTRGFNEQFTDSMRTGFSDLSSSLAKTIENQVRWQEQIERFSERFAEQAKSQEKLADNMIVAAAALEGLLESLSRITGQLNQSSMLISRASETLTLSLNAVHDRLRELMGVQQGLIEELRRELLSITTARGDILEGWKAVAQEAQSSIQIVQEAVRQLGEEVGDNLVQALKQFDQVLAEVIGRFSGTLFETRETINELPGLVRTLGDTAHAFSGSFESVRADLERIIMEISTKIQQNAGRAGEAADNLRASVESAGDVAENLCRWLSDLRSLLEKQSNATADGHLRAILDSLQGSHQEIKGLRAELERLSSIPELLDRFRQTASVIQEKLAPAFDGGLERILSLVDRVEQLRTPIVEAGNQLGRVSHSLSETLEEIKKPPSRTSWFRRR